MAASTSPIFYLDWTFWAVIASAVAIVLSQVPPVRQWVRPGRLAMETTDRVWVTHMLGFPNVQIYLSLRNVGGRSVRVKKVLMEVSRHGQPLCTVAGQTYVPNEAAPRFANLLPFNLSPGEEWAYRVNAFEALPAKEDRDLGKLRALIRADIAAKVHAFKIAHPGEQQASLFEAHAATVDPVLKMFERHFIWEAGEYGLKVRVQLADDLAETIQQYRFTLYEGDSQELRAYSEDYRYGFGVALDYDKHNGVVCELHPA